MALQQSTPEQGYKGNRCVDNESDLTGSGRAEDLFQPCGNHVHIKGGTTVRLHSLHRGLVASGPVEARDQEALDKPFLGSARSID